MPAPSKKRQVWDEVVRLSATLSQAETGEALGVHPYTISKWCREENFAWPVKATGRPKGERVAKACKQCGVEMELQPSQARFREFCSRDCTNEWQRLHHAEHKVTLVCECGKEFEVDPSQVNRSDPALNRRYCSKACAGKYQAKRQPDPANYLTFNCGTCNKEVTRRKKYGSSISGKRFCSNPCAMKHTKTVKNYVIREGDMVLDSGWEMLFAGLCYLAKVTCVRADRENNAIEWETGRWYAPDFYIESMNTWVEVKGQEAPDDAAKWGAWKAEREGRFLVLTEWDLDQMRCAGSIEHWLRGSDA